MENLVKLRLEVVLEIAIAEQTKHGVISGRDALFLEEIAMPTETRLILTGEINTYGGEDEKFEITFNQIVYLSMIEFDFSEVHKEGGSFGTIGNSKIISNFKKMDHSRKLTNQHKHYYFRTYDTVFQVVASKYELRFSAM